MTDIDYDKLAATDDSLKERHADLERQWKYLERRGDPDGTYTERQRPPRRSSASSRKILASRRAPEGQSS
ncbi:hypothetical protein [Rathayibacter iranicus]|uniref:Uncharacterized protein n=2 Tax=Rathayibacter iranicus TaxID=59737 RepID=A0AAD2JG50_9MICO|nr:hypothetical protein [Rathayibacter iranicus]AZZ55023.1 hypothetical protein C7V51_03315 [Rathayibacter iranicus]MWV32252.1 hypothetical protein [Rathayibacter iranicus NCPPB 2253 = VKM Ac-1602]PPI62407.1 hypothetical protein C5E08_03320 [Rathayibacter iranicus]PWJ60803.1 hypothetical protein B0H03_1242 [Rathayibacter iranicus NCPPB 2253 = VKM Ac-1602]